MAARGLWLGVAAGVAALACSAPALAAVRATPRGALVPVQRTAEPVLGWEPIVPRGRDVPAEPEFEAPFQTSTTARTKQVVALKAPQTAAARTFGVLPRFAGAASYEAGNHDPADVQIAVGAGDVVQLVNAVMNVWTTGGTLLKTLSLQSLIGSTDTLGDPRILFDAESGRWLVAAMDISPEHYAVKVGVSQTSDPTGTWSFYGWDSPLASECLDQPRLGYSSQVVSFSANVYDGCVSQFGPVYVGTQLWVLNKAQLLAGQMAQYMSWRPTGMLWSVEPVQSLTASNVEYAVAVSGDIFRVLTITGVPPAATAYTSTDLPIATLSRPDLAVQAGGPYGVDSGTVRTLDAVWSGGTLWASSVDACVPPGDSFGRSCARVMSASTSPLQLLDDRDLTLGPGSYVFYPAVRPDDRGNAVVVFGYSSQTDYPRVGVATKPAQGAWNQWLPLAAGTATQTSGRWGDYFAAAVDPAVGGRVWVSGQVGAEVAGTQPGHGWATVIGSVTPEAVQLAVVTYPAPRVRSITKTSATVLGSVDPEYDETTYRFEYGKSATPYRFVTPWTALPTPLQAQTVGATIRGLAAGTTYHYRLVAKNSLGTTSGADRTFKTKPKPKPKKR